MTNLRSLSALFKVAMKLVAACAFVSVIAAGASAQQTNVLESTGNAGVGTTTPAYPLTVQSAPSADPFVQGYFKSTSTSFPYGGIAVDGNSQSHIRFMLGGTLKWQWRVGAGSAVDDLRAYNWTLAADVMTLKNNGNVGIGTSNPSGNLHVEGSGQNNTLRIISTNATSGGFVGQNTHANAQTVGYLENDRGGFTSYGGFLYGGSNSALGNLFGVSRADKMFLIAGGASNLGMAVGTLSAQPLILGTSNAERMRVDSNGNVGIGTGSPGAKLEVDGDGLIRVTEGNRIVPTSGVGLELSADTTGSYVGAYNRSTSAYRRLYFYGSPYVFEGGNVGIGKSNPTVALDVQGDIKASGTIFAKYQDLAEWVPSSEQLSAATVVVLDTTKSNQVIASGHAYDTRVAGVISAQPGITLGESGAGKVLVATTGRVRVKVDASRAPIQIGDLLVTSDVAGVAMKSDAVNLGGVQIHRPGTIIGKALEPLAKGSGEILVLLSLQ